MCPLKRRKFLLESFCVPKRHHDRRRQGFDPCLLCFYRGGGVLPSYPIGESCYLAVTDGPP